MHAYLISGSSESRKRETERILAEWNVQEFAIVRPEFQNSIGIEHIRTVIKALQLKPMTGSVTVGIIDPGDLLTPDAQQALLKTLEEPPPHVRIIVGVDNSDSLLPTIGSRLERIQQKPDAMTATDETLSVLRDVSELLNLTPGKRLAKLDERIKTKEDAQLFIESITLALSYELHEKKFLSLTQKSLLESLIARKEMIKIHVNPLYIITDIFLTIDRTKNVV